MGLTDDVIDRALDAAEAKISEENSSSQSEGDSSSSESVTTSDQLIEDSAIKESLDKQQSQQPQQNKGRDSSGRFSKAKETPQEDGRKDLSDQVANAESTTEEAQVEEPVAVSTVNPPAFWTAEQKALFTKAPVELQEVIATRELQLQQHMSRLANEAERYKTIEKQLYADFDSDQAIEAHKNRLALDGIKSPIEEMHRYRAWDRVFRTDPKLGISDLMRKNGLTPQDFLIENQEQYYTDPRIEQELQELRTTKSTVEQLKAQLEAQTQQSLYSELEQFKLGKDSSGTVRAQFVELYEPQIASAVTAIKQQNPYMGRTEALNHAYEYVLSEVKKAHGFNSSQPIQSAPVKKPVVEASKASKIASSSNGAPSSGIAAQKSRLKGNSWEEKLNSAIEQAESTMGF